MLHSMRGRLLVATPPLVDENFDRTVVLLLEHGDEGALGLVLNRPADLPIDEPLTPWVVHLTPPSVVFVGGPVETQAVIGLARGDGPATEHWAPVGHEGLGTVDLSAEPTELDTELDALRIFHGYAGWGPGQLEGELDQGAWIVCEAMAEDPFTRAPDDLWRAVLRRQPGRTSWLANYPDDIELN